MPELNYNQIKNILPQAYPFVFIDSVEDYKEGESLTAVKNITANEWPFDGKTAPEQAFPETLLIEAAAQAALLLYHVSKVKNRRVHPKYFIGKCQAEFLKPVAYGQSIRLNVRSGKLLDTGGWADVVVSAEAQEKAKITIFFSVRGLA